MNYKFFIAKRLRTGGDDTSGSSSAPILNIAMAAIVLAVVIMILSIVIVYGFKSEITRKLYSLTPNISISTIYPDAETGLHKVCFDSIAPLMNDVEGIDRFYLVCDKPAVLKTNSDFKGITLRGCDSPDTTYWKGLLTEGRLPDNDNTTNNREILISKTIAAQLQVNCGDKILTYFIDDAVRVRNLKIVGVYNSDFEDYDNIMALCPPSLIRELNDWSDNEGSILALSVGDKSMIQDISYALYQRFTNHCVANSMAMSYSISNTEQDYIAYFSWLNLLDTNIVIILVIMAAVSGFTLIAGLLIIVLGRIRTIGLLKALGCTNSAVRNVFILLTQKLILKAIMLGNVIGIGFAIIQQQFHILSLDPASYYMSFVPIEINPWHIVALNIGIFIVSYLTLVVPSLIISTISPTKALNYE